MPGAWPARIFPDVGMFEEMARIAERGCFDLLFSHARPHGIDARGPERDRKSLDP
jgi:hypothetical protein